MQTKPKEKRDMKEIVREWKDVKEEQSAHTKKQSSIPVEYERSIGILINKLLNRRQPFEDQAYRFEKEEKRKEEEKKNARIAKKKKAIEDRDMLNRYPRRLCVCELYIVHDEVERSF